jgi:hypothetical protein
MMAGTESESELLMAIVGAALDMVIDGATGSSTLSEPELSDSQLSPKVILGMGRRESGPSSSSLDAASISEGCGSVKEFPIRRWVKVRGFWGLKGRNGLGGESSKLSRDMD